MDRRFLGRVNARIVSGACTARNRHARGWPARALLVAACVLLWACDDERSTTDDVSGPETTVADTSSASDTSSDSTTPDVPGTDTTTTIDTPADIAAGGAAYRGEVLFFEPFEDGDFASRGWYDSSSNVVLSTAEHLSTGASAFECRFLQGERGCAGGSPARHQFTEQEAVYLSYWVKYSDNYVGSQRPYHPHEFHFITNKDDRWVGPANTHLTTYIEQNGGTPLLALQDSRNVDSNCILRNNDTFVGCNGNFDTYPFTEDRSVCACNGLLGDLDGRDCFDNGGYWYSARTWRAAERVFLDTPGPHYKGDWHLVEVYFELNSIQGGAGVPDGAIRYWFDGEPVIASDRILMRTASNADMRFNQFLVAPYIGDGSPVEQVMWVDDLTVAAGRRP